MRQHNTTFLIVLGPGLLFIEMILLFIAKRALPAWMGAFIFCVLLTLFIIYHCTKELQSLTEKTLEKYAGKAKDVANMQGLLEEINQINQEKIQLLENDLDVLEIEGQEKIKQTEGQLLELRNAYEKLFDESAIGKSRAQSLRTSLDEALDELRNLRQEHFFLKENKPQESDKQIHAHQKQLREQFEEKKEVLEKTRSALFDIEGKLLCLQKEKEEQKLEDSLLLETLFHSLDTLLKQNDSLKEEIFSLEKIISVLSSRKKTTKKSKTPDCYQIST